MVQSINDMSISAISSWNSRRCLYVCVGVAAKEQQQQQDSKEEREPEQRMQVLPG